MSTKKTIKISNEINNQIMVGCALSAKVYIKALLPSIGEKKLTSFDFPSSSDANDILNNISDIIDIHKKTFATDSDFFAKSKPYNDAFKAYFLENAGGNQVKANNVKVTSWLRACRALTQAQ